MEKKTIRTFCCVALLALAIVLLAGATLFAQESVDTPDNGDALTMVGFFTNNQDIGNVGIAGSSTYNTGTATYTVKGAGADIGGTLDAFQFCYKQNLAENFRIYARVATIQNTNGWAKAGVMIRTSLDPNSPNAYIAVTPSNGIVFQWRTTAGGSTSQVQSTGKTAPYWVRLSLNRTAGTASAFYSTNGTVWTQLGNSISVSWGGVYTGLAVSSHTTSALCTSTFTGVNLSFP